MLCLKVSVDLDHPLKGVLNTLADIHHKRSYITGVIVKVGGELLPYITMETVPLNPLEEPGNTL